MPQQNSFLRSLVSKQAMLNHSLISQDNAAGLFFHVIHWGIKGVTFPWSNYFTLTKDQYLQVKSV